MDWMALISVVMFVAGTAEFWLAARIRNAAWELAAEASYSQDEIERRLADLAKISEALSIEHAETFTALNRFVALWSDGDHDEAVELLREAGFRLPA